MARGPQKSVLNVKFKKPKEASGKYLHGGMASAFGEIVEGFNEFCDNLEQKVLPEAMYDALEPTFDLSQVYVPKDTGELAESGFLDITRKGKGGAQVEIGYGRGGAPYAVYVHEMVNISHEAPTRSKYLEAALDEDYYEILKRIVRYTKYETGL